MITGALEEMDELRKEIEALRAENARLKRFVADCGTTMYPCEVCGHGRSGRGCLHCRIAELELEVTKRDREAE